MEQGLRDILKFMTIRCLLLLAVFVVLPAVGPLRATEHVTLRRDGDVKHVSGRIVVQAQDGGLLVLAPDGVLWTVQPQELLERRTDAAPFRLAGAQQLAQSLSTELPAGFQIYNTAHYVICYNTSKAYAQWCGGLYERLYRAFHNYWERRGLHLSAPQAPLVALVFSRKDLYTDYARQELGDAANSIIGYYSLRTNRITTFDLTGVEALLAHRGRVGTMARINQVLSQPNASPTVSTIVHEATHQLAFNCGLHTRYADVPLWVSEGIAVYFETPDLNSSKGWRGIGAVSRTRLTRLRRYLRERPHDSLATLLADDSRFRNPQQAVDAYAEAWGLCHFLLRRYPRQFTQYLQELAQKKPLLYDEPAERLRLFQRHMGLELEELDAELVRYISRLR